ncbi:hypothetical protein THF1C08_50060 [Vibrio jasicida]|jgi:hypothetical protein|uniref:Uncharacterized protein n=1 Tax=Vibrio jasicida TaxID=766224 RepID=A0AAU9QTS0_9VIBR|nr:hypothetical protein THF1C08_50060 [Vibrio jasicida]CAH1601875.1 hypothetical protein THF1A12_50289 [Vibrio jasicida]
MTKPVNQGMPQEDFDLISYMVLVNFSESIRYEKELTAGEKLAKQLLVKETDDKNSLKSLELRPIKTDGLGTKHIYKNYAVDIVLDNEQFEILVSMGDKVLLQRFLPIEFGMMPSKFREMSETTFKKKIDGYSKNANKLLNIMNYALIDQFIQYNEREEAKVHKHALEGVVLHSFGREVPYYFEFSHNKLLWRYVLAAKRVILRDSNTDISIDFSGNTVKVDIDPRVGNQLGRFNYTSGQAMSCVAELLDSIAKGFKFSGGFITFHKASPDNEDPDLNLAGAAIIKKR